METKFEIRNPKLDGIFISFDTEGRAIDWWRDYVKNATEQSILLGAVVVRHVWETHMEAETARLDFLLGESGVTKFARECLREPLAYSNQEWLKAARVALDIARKSPANTATVIWPK